MSLALFLFLLVGLGFGFDKLFSGKETGMGCFMIAGILGCFACAGFLWFLSLLG